MLIYLKDIVSNKATCTLRSKIASEIIFPWIFNFIYFRKNVFLTI